MRSSIALVATVVVLVAGAQRAAGLERPISGKRLVIQATAPQELSFVSKDPAFLFPAVGSADDPRTGSPGGALLEILSPAEGSIGFTIPPGAGWKAGTSRYRWRNPAAPGGPSVVKVAQLRQGRVLSVRSKLAGLTLAVPATRIAIRVTTGSLRSCAVFEGPSIRRSVAGRFVAANAPAPTVADCSDASLLPPPTCASAALPTCGGTCAPGEDCVPDVFSQVCHCVSQSTPCGETSPTCNGQCPAGEECVGSGLNFPFNSCGCIPIGSTPCGSPGPPACGGACPTGTTCSGIFAPPSLGGGVVCGCEGAGMTCPDGFAFGGAPEEGFPPGCYPIVCGATYPTCGGGCLDGGVCTPVAFDTGPLTSFCLCALPLPCGEGGYACPAGEACRFSTGGLACGPP